MTGYVEILTCLVVVFAAVEFLHDHYTQKDGDQDL